MEFAFERKRLRKLPLAIVVLAGCAVAALAPHARAEKHPAPLAVADSDASTEAEMKPYTELIEHTEAKIPMVPIRGGSFLMGSPQSEKDRNEDEGPQHNVKIAPFWMGKYEITWDAYEVWMEDVDVFRRKIRMIAANRRDELANEYQLTQPTEPYTDMSFGMGKGDRPAICMTQLSARTFCQWLSAKTGRYYRLPTEAEWEYACRAGTTTAYHFGDDPAKLEEYAWYFDNTSEKYEKVGQKKPNPWGLYDMHGNASEWVLDQHATDFYGSHGKGVADNPLAIPKTIYPRVVRGGGWNDEPVQLRSAACEGSCLEWKEQDPQEPQSIWYLTDAHHVGFRIIRPLVEPTDMEKAEKWDKSEPVEDRKEKD